jgi:predicted nuclease of predicted toxin-antitoxin system
MRNDGASNHIYIMRLLLDEDSGARSLQAALRTAGHDVLRVVDVPELGNGTTDSAVFNYAVLEKRCLVTKNGADFAELANAPDAPVHPGIVVIHYNQNGMSLEIASVVLAVANIASTYRDCSGLFLSANQHVW